MKTLIAVVMQFIRDRPSRINIMSLFKFIGMIATIVVIYGIIFHQIMAYEGREESWFTGVYWALTVMSTLGFGDITFQSDLGRIFSVFVLVTGIILLLVLLPFTFIEFFYEPYMKAQQAARTPTELPEKTHNHAILTKFDVVTRMLIERLLHYHYDYVLIVSDINEASQLLDQGYKVMIGDLDDPKTYQLARVDQALFVASTVNDQVNANIVFTVREISDSVPIIATASSAASLDILKLAGASHVLQLGEMMGRTLARQVSNGATQAHVIGQFYNLQIAEAGVRGTSLVGKTLEETGLGHEIGVNILGMWERGIFQPANPATVITCNMTMVMAGFEEHITQYNQIYHPKDTNTVRAIIIGGGRVGRAVAKSLAERHISYTIVEKRTDRIRGDLEYLLGDGAEIEVLERAGIREATSIIITTRDDDMNVYLTIYCRRLRPDAQIISRSAFEKNVATLHRAGADFVMSYATTGANAIINLIGRDNILMVAEGLDIFEVLIPDTMVGKTIAECNVRNKTGCTIVGLRYDEHVEAIPDPHKPLPDGVRLILIGMRQAEERFLKMFMD